MSETEYDKIDELLELVKENNRILRAMYRKQVLGQVMTFLYWMIIIGAAGWAYYYTKPYLDQYIDMYQNIMRSIKTVEQTGASLPSDVNKLLESVKR